MLRADYNNLLVLCSYLHTDSKFGWPSRKINKFLQL